ncbi:hypothetical protein AAW51_4130 [Caldimonas brevitalea]|uniref:Uncharacterized protein n=2 Tax=Caldimonas brevitalea TaxID=413882 RepID=A0A0G3BTY9_9BURK|nr:hypothetical protein AAW51_4130 [Caldimonas brevitalea]
MAGGCRLTRDVPALLKSAGFTPTYQMGYVARPKSLAYNFWGDATCP